MSSFETGPKDAKICILGEAPSTEELRKGEPLVGPSGRMFDELCNSAGLLRRNLYITNLFPFKVTKDRTGQTIYGPEKEVLWTQKHGLTSAGEEHASSCRS